MANKKINELVTRTPSLTDLLLVGDPSSGYSYKCTVTSLADIIQTDIADAYVTIDTTQTVTGAKTFTNVITATSVANTPTDPDKFLTLNGSNQLTYRTGSQVLSDIGGADDSLVVHKAGDETITGIKTFTPRAKFDGSINLKQGSGASIDSGYSAISTDANTFYFYKSGSIFASLNVVNLTNSRTYTLQDANGTLAFLTDIPSVTGFVPYTGATSNVNLGIRTLTATGIYSSEAVYVANTYGVFGRNAANNAYNQLIGITGTDKVYIDAGGVGTTIGGTLTLSVINNATTNTNTFLVSDSGVIKYRTGTQLLSDIGGASSSSISGTTNYIPKFTSSSAIGNSVIYESSSNIGIGTTSPALPLHVYNSGAALTYFESTNVNGGYVIWRNSGTSIGDIGSALGISGSGSASDFMVASRSGSLVFGTGSAERMRLTSTGLGIGTSSPAYKLDVSGTIKGSSFASIGASSIYGIYRRDNSNYAGGWYSAAGEVTLDMASVGSALTMSALGNLGLGVTPSAWSGVTAFQNKQASFSADASSNIASFGNNFYYNGSANLYYQNGGVALYQQFGNQHIWYNAPSGTAGNAISFTQAMTLDASGRLGIGTTSPSGVFHAQATNSGIFFDLTTAYTPKIKASGTISDIQIESVGNGANVMLSAPGSSSNIILYTNSSERMRITGSGNVGIGTTSPTKSLEVYNSGSTNTAQIVTSDGSSTRKLYLGTFSNTAYLTFGGTYESGWVANGTNAISAINMEASSGASAISFATSTTNGAGPSERMRITSGGEVYIAGTTDQGAYNLQVNGTGVWGAGAYVNGSDSALKENIQNMGSALNLVNQLQPKTFTYKPTYSRDTTIQVGFIAQDLEQVLGNQIYKNSIVVDGPNFKSVAYQNLIPLLVQSIKELKAEIETLKNK